MKISWQQAEPWHMLQFAIFHKHPRPLGSLHSGLGRVIVMANFTSRFLKSGPNYTHFKEV